MVYFIEHHFGSRLQTLVTWKLSDQKKVKSVYFWSWRAHKRQALYVMYVDVCCVCRELLYVES